MLRPGYALLIARWLWLKLRWRGRLKTDGLCFVCPGVKFEIGRDAYVHARALVVDRPRLQDPRPRGRALDRRQVRARPGVHDLRLPAHSIGRECIIADRVMMIDFDHGMVEVERPIREQGIYKRDVNVGHNVWIGYGACVLRGVIGRRQLRDRHQRRRDRATCPPTPWSAASPRG